MISCANWTMPPRRGLRFVGSRVATKMPLLTELSPAAVNKPTDQRAEGFTRSD